MSIFTPDTSASASVSAAATTASSIISPRGRIPTLLQTAGPIENPRAARQALISWLARLGLSAGGCDHGDRGNGDGDGLEMIADAILTHFDLVPRGLGAVLRDAARSMHTGATAGSGGSAALSALGSAVLLAVHEAYGPELARPSASALAEEHAAARK